MQNIRNLVYNSLINCIENDRYSNLEASSVIEKNTLSPRDRSFYTAFFYGVTEKTITIDYQIRKLSRTPIEKLQTKVLVLLRMGIYQILFMDSVPDHAAINETVAVAKQYVNKGAVGFINALLRAATRQLKSNNGDIKLITPNRERDICGYLSIHYSFPRYLCKLWINAYGEKNAERIMIAENKRSSLTIRVNTLKISRGDYLQKLLLENIDASESKFTEDGINVYSGTSIYSLPNFEDGYFFIQDDSSRMCVEALDPKPFDTVLDACACPGGKSFASAIKMNGQGKIISCDIHDSKLSLIDDGAKRLGIEIIKSVQADSSVFNKEFAEQFDKVLCDVPCSGFGTISKKPDLRLKQLISSQELPRLQLSIANNCAKYVKTGGTLVYSTCTLNPEENENNVLRFCESNPEFRLESMTTKFPYDGEYDGFFIAKMIRIK